jgi:hypothetical protein
VEPELSERIQRVIGSVYFAPGVVLLIAAVLRVVYLLTRGDLWVDEAITAMLAGLGLMDLHSLFTIPPVRSTVLHVHPPLYYLLLRGWTSIFSDSEIALRSLSLVFDLATIGCFWSIVKRHLGSTPAWIAALLMAVSPLQVHYASEARYYSLFLFFSVLSVGAFLRICTEDRGWPGYVLSTAACLYTFYYAFFVILGQNLAMLWFGLARDRRRWLPWAGAQLAVGALFLPWAGVFLHQYTSYPKPGFDRWIDFVPVLGNVAGDLVGHGLEPQLATAALVTVGVSAAVALWWRLDGSIVPAAASLIWLSLPLVLLRYLATVKVEARTLVFVTPALCLLVSLPLAEAIRLRRRWRVVTAGALVTAIIGLSVHGVLELSHETLRLQAGKTPWSAFQRIATDVAGPRPLVVLPRGKLAVMVDYYLGPSVEVVGFFRNPEMDPAEHERWMVDSLSHLIDRHERFWLLTLAGNRAANRLLEAEHGAVPEPDRVVELVGYRASCYRSAPLLPHLRVVGDRSATDSSPTIDLSTAVELGLPAEIDTPELEKTTQLRVFAIARFPHEAPFFGVIELAVDGEVVDSDRVGADFATVNVLEAEIAPEVRTISVSLRPGR